MHPQLALFEKNDQISQLERVRHKLAKTIMQFCRSCLLFRRTDGPTFHMDELVDYCKEQHKCSYDSPSRTLRQLREDGVVRYEVVDKSSSLYKVLGVEE